MVLRGLKSLAFVAVFAYLAFAFVYLDWAWAVNVEAKERAVYVVIVACVWWLVCVMLSMREDQIRTETWLRGVGRRADQ